MSDQTTGISRIVQPEPRSAPDTDANRARPESEASDNTTDYAAEYRKLQSSYGRQANEVGELRRKVAEYEAQLQSTREEPVSWDESPERAVDQRIKPLRDKLQELETARVHAELTATHPQWRDTFQAPEFREWMQDRKSRMLLAMTAEGGDVDAARELLDLYTEARDQGHSTPKQTQRRENTVRAARTERGTGKAPLGQVWRRQELINLKIENPTRYNELLPDIRKAYAEGRVIG